MSTPTLAELLQQQMKRENLLSAAAKIMRQQYQALRKSK